MLEKIKARLFVDAPLAEGAEVALEGGAFHYLAHTLRMGVGDAVALFNGKDGEWRARIAQVGKKGMRAQAEALLRAQENAPDVWLAFAPVKNEKIDYTVRRATELGVSALLPVMTQRTIVSRVNTERLRANAVEAAEQSGRMDVPEIKEPQALAHLLAAWPVARTLIFCDEAGEGAALRDFLPALRGGAYGVLIGPEGGFSPEERGMLKRLPFVRAVSLGERILRAETAALAMLANLMAWVDWR